MNEKEWYHEASHHLSGSEEPQEDKRLSADGTYHFETLVRKYTPSLRSYTAALLRKYDGDVVDEIVQKCWVECYLYSLRYGSSWLTSLSIRGWLRTVAYHTVIDYLKREGRTLSLSSEEGIRIVEHLSHPRDQPESVLIRDETAALLSDALYFLPSFHQSLVLILFYVYEYSLEEIATSLQCPINTVKSHLRRARIQLKKDLEEQGVTLEDLRNLQGLGIEWTCVILMFMERYWQNTEEAEMALLFKKMQRLLDIVSSAEQRRFLRVLYEENDTSYKLFESEVLLL